MEVTSGEIYLHNLTNFSCGICLCRALRVWVVICY